VRNLRAVLVCGGGGGGRRREKEEEGSQGEGEARGRKRRRSRKRKGRDPISPPIPDINECSVYGNSGKPTFVKGCTTKAVNQRTITCEDGYYPLGGTGMASNSIDLVGNTAFAGCSLANMCTTYGYSGKPDNTVSCTVRIFSEFFPPIFFFEEQPVEKLVFFFCRSFLGGLRINISFSPQLTLVLSLAPLATMPPLLPPPLPPSPSPVPPSSLDARVSCF
jgi:hypothetical protein